MVVNPAHRRHILGGELILGVGDEEAGLADCPVPHHNTLEEEVEVAALTLMVGLSSSSMWPRVRRCRNWRQQL